MLKCVLQCFDELIETSEIAKSILTRIRHGLRHEQFAHAKERFANCGNNIDTFIKSEYDEQVELFKKLNSNGKDFYGQAVTDDVDADLLFI